MSEPEALVAPGARVLAALAGSVVVAVSGGPDSVALLRAILQVREEPVVIAHLNHQLRGPESDADEAFVRDLHARLVAAGRSALHLRVQRLDVAAQAQAEGDNLENTARRLRYGWLTTVAQEMGAPWVATGHTADDQAETVLHRLLRGTGLKGLSGIPARRSLAAGVDVVRPLLRVRRAEVLAYLEVLGQEARHDRSNADLRFTRNRLRHELLPHLATQYNPAISTILCQLAEQATEVQQSEETAAGLLLAEAERPRAGTWIILDRSCLARAPRHRLRELFRLIWQREGWSQTAMSFAAWDRAAAVAQGEMGAVDLPGLVQVRRCGRVVRVERR